MALDASAQLFAIGKALREAGDRGNLNAMRRAMRVHAAPLIGELKRSAHDNLPHTGGLNQRVAGERISVSTRTGARSAGIRLTTSAPDTADTNAGFVRHPVFGHKDRWVQQDIPRAEGWWDRPAARSGPVVAAAMAGELEKVARAIAAAGA